MIEKERISITKTPEGKQKVVRKPEFAIPKEVDNWIEKVEKGDIFLSKPVTDDQTGQVLVTAPSAQKPKITLPLSKQSFIYGKVQDISEAIRWLAELCLKIIKMNPKGVQFKQKSNDDPKLDKKKSRKR